MAKSGFFPRLALVNLLRNHQVTLPYLITVLGTSAAYYMIAALSQTDFQTNIRYAYLSVFMSLGTVIVAIFAVLFLTYTNGFLMKRRNRELGLYHILGLGKGHLAILLGLETLYTALIGIGGGILLGILLQKLSVNLLSQILHTDTPYGTSVSSAAVQQTVLLFTLILLWNLLRNMLRIGKQNPVELLQESHAGEQEPKTRLPVAILGILCLGGGYSIALFVQSAMDAFTLYFLAVLLVIIGTYCLFYAVSIAVLKALKKNKGFYYQPEHFINISGMLYRMRRNAAGLSNICILSTMVLVMISGTLSLYLSSEQTLSEQFAGNISVTVRYDLETAAPDSALLDSAVLVALDNLGHPASSVYQYRYLSMLAEPREDGYTMSDTGVYSSASVYVNLLTAADYANITGSEPDGVWAPVTFQMPDGAAVTVNVFRLQDTIPVGGEAALSTVETFWLLLKDDTALQRIYELQKSAGNWMTWQGFWNANGTDDELMELDSTLETALVDSLPDGWVRFSADTRAAYAADYYSLNGGFLFLGIFLGTLFMLASALILYYKQLSENYEDREQYHIMQNVGMEPKLIRRSIGSQILVVFFAPLSVAAIHVAFDYRLMLRLLTLFGLHKPWLTLLCTVGTFVVFAVWYAFVYLITVSIFYKRAYS